MVCEPRIQERSSRPLYRFSPLFQGAIIWGVPPLFPRLMVGTPCLCDFKSAGNKVGKSVVSVAAKPGVAPPGVMRMRLLEYVNAASLMRCEPMVEVNLPTRDFEGCAQLLSSCG